MKKKELKHQIVYQNYQVQKVKVVKMKNHKDMKLRIKEKRK
jgi:hypothetical protein